MEVVQLGHECAPRWDTGTTGRGIDYYTMTLVPVVDFFRESIFLYVGRE